MQTTYYEVLGIWPGAQKEEVKAAYHAKALEAHPDNGGSTEQFRVVNDAYKVLIHPTSRCSYDLSLALLLGKCERCDGQGFIVKMTSLFDRKNVECPDCKGRGFGDKGVSLG